MSWKIYIVMICAGLVCLLFLAKKLGLPNAINIFLTYALVITTILYAEKTAKMAQIMAQSNRLNFRPYIQIEGYPTSLLDRMNLKKEVTSPLQPHLGQEERGFGTALDPQNNECLLYSLLNVGNVPARNIVHEVKVFEWSEKYAQPKEIKIPNIVDTEREVVFPKADSRRLLPLGKHIVFRTISDPLFIDVIIKIMYQGNQELDKRIYFTTKKLRIPVRPSPEGNTQITILDQDEGSSL